MKFVAELCWIRFLMRLFRVNLDNLWCELWRSRGSLRAFGWWIELAALNHTQSGLIEYSWERSAQQIVAFPSTRTQHRLPLEKYSIYMCANRIAFVTLSLEATHEHSSFSCHQLGLLFHGTLYICHIKITSKSNHSTEKKNLSNFKVAHRNWVALMWLLVPVVKANFPTK